MDHPHTQAWKLARLAAAGFRSDAPAVSIWLGVVPYLRRPAIALTLRYISTVPDAEVIFDYSEPLKNYPPARRDEMMALGERAAAMGKPWLSHFGPAELAVILAEHGLTDQEDMGVGEIARRYLGAPAGRGVDGPGPHVMRARVASSGAA